MNYIIAIDGISGTGKSTVCKMLAKRLNFNYINSGNIYRAITYILIKRDVSSDSIDSIISNLSSVNFNFLNCSGVFVNGECLENELRELMVENSLKKIVQIPKIREIVNSFIIREALCKNCVIDGRDVGTNIFPYAQVKFFFLKNSTQKDLEMAFLTDNFINQDFNISERDNNDIRRNIAPLRKAKDAIFIHSFDYSIEQLLDYMEFIVKTKLN